MGIEALYRKPNTSKKHPGHKVYPYFLRELKIERANQVWATDITYIPMACGGVYLCAALRFNDLETPAMTEHRARCRALRSARHRAALQRAMRGITSWLLALSCRFATPSQVPPASPPFPASQWPTPTPSQVLLPRALLLPYQTPSAAAPQR